MVFYFLNILSSTNLTGFMAHDIEYHRSFSGQEIFFNKLFTTDIVHWSYTDIVNIYQNNCRFPLLSFLLLFKGFIFSKIKTVRTFAMFFSNWLVFIFLLFTILSLETMHWQILTSQHKTRWKETPIDAHFLDWNSKWLRNRLQI